MHASLDFKSSYKVKYNKKSNLNNIKIWRSITYNKIDNVKKLDKRVKSYILIDYDSNEYKLLDLKTKRVVWSRNIVVLEEIFPYKWKNDEDYDINDYVNSNNNYEIIFDNAIESHTSFREDDVDRAEKQLINQHLEYDMISNIEDIQSDIETTNLSDNTQSDNSQSVNSQKVNSQITNQIIESDELNNENSQNHQSSSYAKTTNKRVSLNEVFDDELAFAVLNNNNANDSVTYKQTVENSNAKLWKIAMQKKIDDLKSQKIWQLVDLLKNRKPIKDQWVYKIKLDKNENIDKYKAW